MFTIKDGNRMRVDRLNGRELSTRRPVLAVRDKGVGVYEFACNEWQHDFLTRDEPRVLAAVGGIGSGKTWSLGRWSVLECRYEAGTGTLGLLAANSYQQLAGTVLPHVWAFLDEIGFKYGESYVFNEQPPRFWRRFHSRFKKDHKNVVSIRPWGQMLTRSLENYDDLRGFEFGYIGQDEARGSKQEAFLVLQGRLRCPRARRLRYRFVTSPNGFDWIYKEMVDRADEFGEERQLIQMKTSDNILGLPPGYTDTLRKSYDEKMAQQELEGKFVSITSGLVYHAFDRTINVKPSIEGVPELDWQISFDFNRSPYSVAIVQTHGHPDRPEEQIIYVVDEIYAQDCDTERACREVFHRLEGKDTRGRIEVYGDASGNARSTRSNQSDYDIISREFSARYGNRFVRKWRQANPAVMARVNAVNAMLRNSVGESRLFISPRCKNLRTDFEQVAYTVGTNQIDKTKDPKLTHLSDAIGYYIAERFPVRRPGASLVFI